MKLKNRREFYTLIAGVAVLAALSACSDEQAAGNQSADDIKGMKIVPVFGPDRMDVTADVEWQFSRVGKAEDVQRANGQDDGAIFWIDWASTFDPLGADGVYPVNDGEIGVDLSFKSYKHMGLYKLPAPVDGNQIVEIEITDKSRLVVAAEGLSDDALVDFGLNGIAGQASGGGVSTTGWRNHRGVHYVTPGTYEVTLKNVDTSESHMQTVTLDAGASGTVQFTFSQ